MLTAFSQQTKHTRVCARRCPLHLHRQRQGRYIYDCRGEMACLASHQPATPINRFEKCEGTVCAESKTFFPIHHHHHNHHHHHPYRHPSHAVHARNFHLFNLAILIFKFDTSATKSDKWRSNKQGVPCGG